MDRRVNRSKPTTLPPRHGTQTVRIYGMAEAVRAFARIEHDGWEMINLISEPPGKTSYLLVVDCPPHALRIACEAEGVAFEEVETVPEMLTR